MTKTRHGTLAMLAASFMTAAVATPVAQAQNFKLLHQFAGTDGIAPQGTLVRDSAGNLYGTASQGGSSNQVGCFTCGVVFKLDTAGTLTVLHYFTGGADGSFPMAGLTEDAKGNLYGTASYGGNDSDITCNYRGCGVVFKLNTAGTTFKTLYTFQGSPDGQGPQGVLVRDAKGNLYGTTAYGGTIGVGTVFELSPAGNETAEYSFTDGPAMYGGSPLSGVIRDSAGNLYGTTASGDGSGGVVYKLDTSGNETPLFFFPLNPSEYGVDGAFPLAPLTRDAAGNLYGTTTVGGTGDAVGNCPVGCGVVFKVDTAGNTTVLHNFAGPEGNEPVGGVIQDAAGNLYGTTTNGGTGQFINGCGVVFKLTPAGKLKVLYNFTGGTDGAGPWAGLACDRANLDKPCPTSGYLYGSTTGASVPYGGAGLYGTLFSIKY